MLDAHPTESHDHMNGTELRGLVVASLAGLAINVLSSTLEGSPIYVLIGVAAVLGVLVAAGVIKTRAPGQSVPGGAVSKYLPGLTFFLAMFLLGTLIGLLSVLPLFPLQLFRVPDFVSEMGVPGVPTNQGFYGYELLAASVVAILGALARLRGQTVGSSLSFVVSATAGTTFAMVALRSDDTHDFVLTFVGWTLAASVVVLLLHQLPSIFRLLWNFWSPRAGSKRLSAEILPDLEANHASQPNLSNDGRQAN